MILTLLFAFFFHDWPQMLGPSRNGVYTDSDVTWPSKIAWKKQVGAGLAAPVIVNGKVILFHRRSMQEIVEAFDDKTGKSLWTFSYPTNYRDDFGWDEGPRSAPTVADGKVFTFGAEGVLHAIDLAKGKKLWRVDVQKTYDVPKGFFGAACAPLYSDGKVFLSIGSKQAGVGAFDANTGKLIWKSSNHEMSYSSPILSSFGLIFFTRAGLLVTETGTGKILHEQPFRSRSGSSVNAATPLLEGNILFLTSSYGTGALALDISKTPPVKLWANDDSLSAHYATPVIKDGYLYGLHGRAESGQELRAVELRTGKVAWNMEAGGTGSVTLLKDKLMFLRDDGEMFQVNASPKKLEMLSHFKATDGKVRALPAVGNGLVCLRNETYLTCYR